MKQGSFSSRERAARKSLWAVIVLCCESVLTAVPTIAIFSDAQSPGIHVEGIILDSLHTFRPIELDGLERMQTADWEVIQHASLFEKNLAAGVPGFPLRVSSCGLRQDLDYITCSTTSVAWTPDARRLASGIPWAETTPFHRDSVLWLLSRQ